MIEILIGSDPETFVRSKKTGEIVSAHNLIPGTKVKPFRVPFGAIQVDGVAAEFNTDPAASAEEFILNHRMVLEYLNGQVGPDFEVVAQPTAWFDQKYFDALPEEVKLLGCTPDYNAYTGEPNIPPSTELPFRTGGGHIHIGFGMFLDINDPEHFELCRRIVRQLDIVLFDQSKTWDSDEERRKLYGSKGAFRPKSYGVEYRPLSNRWLQSEETIRFVYEAAHRAVDLLLNHEVTLEEWDQDNLDLAFDLFSIPVYKE